MDQTNPNLYELKKIKFLNRTVPIILQNKNGPCPLLAIANVLLLRGTISINLDYSTIKLEDLVSLIADNLVEASKKNSSIKTSKELELSFQQNLNDSIMILPKMQYGLDVNVKFKHIKDFEYTPECVIFDLLDIDLVHGWLAEPEADYYSVVISLSYNQIQEKLVQYHSLTSENNNNNMKPNDSQILQEGSKIEKFMKETASQLSFQGLMDLHKSLRDNQLCVFFRNNHFSTLFKYKDVLYNLITDAGYKYEPVVWEKLDMVDNDIVFCTEDFRVYEPNSKQQETPAFLLDAKDLRYQQDLQLAMELHHQELRESQNLAQETAQKTDLHSSKQQQQQAQQQLRNSQQKQENKSTCIVC